VGGAVVARSGRVALPETPYKGLTPYDEADAELFFGRDVWCEIVTDNLKAYRLTLFYGESGVGKSSLLRAGVAHRLRMQAPVLVFSSWRGDVEQSLVEALDALAGVGGETNGYGQPPGATLEAAIERCALRSGGRVFLILDQFEEYFVYHPVGSPDDAFAAALPRALSRQDVPLSVLISIREDAVARLDRFKSRVPNLFDNSLRLDHLNRAAAREAIERPLARWRETRPGAGPSAIEPELVETVLDEVKAGTLEVTQGSAVTAAGSVEEVETPYLQLVLTRLWSEEAAAGSPVMRLSTVQRLGGAQGIVSTHLESAMESLPQEDRDIAAAAFRYLVTRSRSKIAHSVTDLADWTDVDQERLAGVLERLSGGDARILRPVGEGSYEIYHDVLADAILAWRAGHEAARLSEEVLRRSIARLALVAGIIAFAVVALLALLAHSESNQAKEESARAQDASARAAKAEAVALSREFAVQATTLGRNDYDLGLGLAAAAWDKAHTDQALQSLTQILGWPPLRPPKRLAVGRERVWDASFSDDGTRILTIGARSVGLWDAAGRRRIRTLESGRGAPYGAFSGDGGRVVSGTPQTAPVVWDARTGSLVATLPRASIGSRAATIDATGRLVATTQPDGRVTVWRVSDGRVIDDVQAGPAVFVKFTRRGKTFSATRRDGSAIIARPGASRATVLPRLVNGGWIVSSDARHAFGTAFRARSRLAAITAGRPRPTTVEQFPRGTYGRFTPDGRRLFISRRARATLLDAGTARPIETLRFPGQIEDIAPSRDGRKAVVRLVNGAMRLWDTNSKRSRQFRTSQRRTDSFVASADLSPQGRRLVTTEFGGKPGIWDLGGEQGAQLYAGDGQLSAVAVGPRADLIAIGTTAGAVRLTRAISGEQLRVLHAGEGPVVATRFNRDGTKLLTADADGTVAAWDVGSGRRVATMRRNGAALIDARLSADGTLVVTADARGAAAVWRVGDSRPMRVLRAGKRRLLSASFSPDGARVVTAERGTYARVWDLRSGRPLAQLRRHRRYRLFGFVPSPGVEFSPDGTRVLMVGTDGGLRLWDDHGRLLKERRGSSGAIVNHATFNPDGRLIAAGSDDGAVHVLDGHTGEEVRKLRAPDSEVGIVAFSPDSDQVVGTAVDGTTRVWNVRTGKRLMLVTDRAPFGFWWAGFTADGARIATTDTDRSIRVRICAACLPPAQVAALAKRTVKRPLKAWERRRYLHER
jgi:WD40 repeat protein